MICFKALLPFFFVAALDGAVQAGLVPYDDLATWYAQLNADVKLFSQRVMAVVRWIAIRKSPKSAYLYCSPL